MSGKLTKKTRMFGNVRKYLLLWKHLKQANFNGYVMSLEMSGKFAQLHTLMK